MTRQLLLMCQHFALHKVVAVLNSAFVLLSILLWSLCSEACRLHDAITRAIDATQRYFLLFAWCFAFLLLLFGLCLPRTRRMG